MEGAFIAESSEGEGVGKGLGLRRAVIVAVSVLPEVTDPEVTDAGGASVLEEVATDKTLEMEETIDIASDDAAKIL